MKMKEIAVTTEPALISKQSVSLGDNVSVTQDGLEKGVRGVSLRQTVCYMPLKFCALMLLENVEHCGGEPEQADRILMSDVNIRCSVQVDTMEPSLTPRRWIY